MADFEQILFLALGTCGLIWFLLPVILIAVLWGRVNRLRDEIKSLRQGPIQAGRRSRAAETSTPTKEAESFVDPADIEVVQPPRRRASEQVAISRRGDEGGMADRERPSAPKPRSAEEVETGGSSSIEEILAGRWLGWAGAIALILCAGYGFKYAIDTEVLGPTGRVVIGIVIGMFAFAGAAYAMLQDYRWQGQALAGAAAGVLYFSLFAAHDFYGLISIGPAFAGMAVVTVAVLAFSTIFHSQPTAIIGLIGGFLTPIMLSTGADRQWELFSYIFLLDLGVLGIASFRKWQPLQLTAFGFTLLMWLGWFREHYQPEKLTSTIILMTAFFLLFALLGVWHNTLKRLPAKPGDFVLMLATPVVYFIALYGVTKSDFSAWHGLMAVGLAGSYLGLAMLQLSRNPSGKPVIVCLAGIAASFLTVAIPLQLTGHWIAIAWAAESLLLVELGLRFGQPKLQWAGFGLLAVVQLILVFYSVQTFDHPGSFQTRFRRVDPIAVDVMPSRVIEAEGSQAADEPSWTDVFNGRSFSFLASALVMAILAWEYRRRRDSEATSVLLRESSLTAGWLTALVPMTLLGMMIVETFVLGYRYDWIGPTLVGLFTVWTALAAAMLLVTAVRVGPEWLNRVGLGLFALVALLLLASLGGTLIDWRSEWHRLSGHGAIPGIWRLPLMNPRGVGFLSAMGAAIFGAVLFLRRDRDDSESEAIAGPLSMAGLLGVFAHLTGLAMLTTETYAQGVIHDWKTWTALSITIVWLAYAIGTIVAGIYYRSGVVRILALALFVLTAGKVFLYDVFHVSEAWKWVAFGSLGVALMLVSFFYRRYQGRIREWLTASAALLAGGLLLGAGSGAVLADDPRPVDPLHTLAYRWSIPDTLPEADATGLVRLPVPPELYGVTRDDMGDVRIIAVERGGERHADVPFVLHRPVDVIEVTEREIPLLNLSEIEGETQLLLDVGSASEPIREIVVNVSPTEHNFERAVTVFGADRRDAERWAELTSDGYLLDRTRGAHRLRVKRVRFPRSVFRYYKVVIENDGAEPLQIDGAMVADRNEVLAPRRELPTEILERRLDPETKQTMVIVDVGYDRIPTDALRFEFDYNGDYYRPVRLEIADELKADPAETRWRALASFAAYRISRPGREPAVDDTARYSERRGRYVRAVIENGRSAAAG
ncbi:MAG: DUF2339 domain-containing protein [Planctomycetota bacterium]|nr:MAG: DUF2339 domain-containing protein [Planctomycetota bacterium]